MNERECEDEDDVSTDLRLPSLSGPVVQLRSFNVNGFSPPVIRGASEQPRVTF